MSDEKEETGLPVSRLQPGNGAACLHRCAFALQWMTILRGNRHALSRTTITSAACRQKDTSAVTERCDGDTMKIIYVRDDGRAGCDGGGA
jgi:hypothetical protein